MSPGAGLWYSLFMWSSKPRLASVLPRALVALVSCSLVAGCGSDRRVSADLPPNSFSVTRAEWTLRWTEIDVLFVIDNAGSMAGKQETLLRSIESFAASIDELFWGPIYRIAVVTTGMESQECRPCEGDGDTTCINETGENGRFQNRVGHLSWDGDVPVVEHEAFEPFCKVVDESNMECLHNPDDGSSIALVGFNGCGYRRGLEAMRAALGSPLIETWNSNFLRPDSELLVIVISDGEDCGRVGEVAEGIGGAGETVCSYAANGTGPGGGAYHPDDQDQRPYELSPVREYHDFLMELKDGREGMVKFAAFVGLDDPNDPEALAIRFDGTHPNASVVPACTVPGCTGEHCDALPGTRYVELARLFGLGEGGSGFVDTICQDDLFAGMQKLLSFISMPRSLGLPEPMLDPALAIFSVEGEPIPHYSCQTPGFLLACEGPDDPSCPESECVKTWRYLPPGHDPTAPGGTIELASHVDLHTLGRSRYRHYIRLCCSLHFELVYVVG